MNNINLPCTMKIITDQRSQKFNEINNNNNYEIVAWFPKMNNQNRV